MGAREIMKYRDFKHEGFNNKTDEEIKDFYAHVAGKYTLFEQHLLNQEGKKRFYSSVGNSFSFVIAGYILGYVFVWILVFKFVMSLFK